VRYADYEASVLIQEGAIDKGYLPNRQMKLVLAWCEIYRDALMQNWELSKQGKPLDKIAPLI